MRISPTIEVTGTVIRETEKAYLFRHEDDTEDKWIPKSQVLEIDIEDGVAILIITEWIAEEKGYL